MKSQKRITNIGDQKTRSRFLPAWYLKKGTINADEVELESASSSCESWAVWCGALVILAVASELVVAFFHPAYDSRLQQWGSVASDFALGIGIVGEVLLDMRNNRLQTALRNRSNAKLANAEKSAADANERAAALLEAAHAHELRLRELSLPRKFDFEKFREVMALDPRPGTKAEVFYVRDCSDCIFLASMIRAALLGSKWDVIEYGPIPEPPEHSAHLPAAFSVKGLPYGVTIVSKVLTFLPSTPRFPEKEDSPSGVLHFAISRAIESAYGSTTGQTDESMPDNAVRVVIAPRP